MMRFEQQIVAGEEFSVDIPFPVSSRADPYRADTAAGVPSTKVLGVPVSTINLPVAVMTINDWISRGRSEFICVRDVHGVMRAQDDPALMAIHHSAGLITPDGMPLVWIVNARGYKQASRVCGADLVAALCQASQETGARHYFYGGKPGVAERMIDRLHELYPRLQVCGSSTPPFRPLTTEEDDAEIRAISATRPQVVWVGLSTPKQEYWMRDHVGRIPGAILIGIGAAFDFYAGDVKRAPRWMQKSGLEWLHRLLSEPRRLWWRYLVLAPRFVAMVLSERLRTRGLRG